MRLVPAEKITLTIEYRGHAEQIHCYLATPLRKVRAKWLRENLEDAFAILDAKARAA